MHFSITNYIISAKIQYNSYFCIKISVILNKIQLLKQMSFCCYKNSIVQYDFLSQATVDIVNRNRLTVRLDM